MIMIGMLVMEVDKVADEVTDMEVDKVADMNIPIEDLTEVILEIGDWVKIPLEDFSGETLLIGDTYGDDVRGGYMCDGHGGWQGGWHGIEDS